MSVGLKKAVKRFQSAYRKSFRFFWQNYFLKVILKLSTNWFGTQEEKVEALVGNMFLLSRLRPLPRPLKGDSC